MPRRGPGHLVLPDLFDLAEQLQRDQGRERAWLWRRDRRIGGEVASLKHRPALQVAAWLDRAATQPGDRVAGRRMAQAQRLVVLGLVILGLALGWATAAAVFYYTGERPVNVVAVLAVFVGLQAVLLVLFILAAAPDRVLRLAPGAEAVIESLRLLSPGRLAPMLGRLLPQDHREAIDAAVGRGRSHQQRFGAVRKWTVLTWSQGFAVAFNVGALMRYLYLVVFSDLAFVWSTTLRTDASTFHRIVRGLAAPWAWALPEAAPDYELVRATRYFRFEGGRLAHEAAAPELSTAAGYLGQWWPFLLLCLIVYGLAPRVVTLLLCAWRMRRAVTTAALQTPGVSAVLDRLNSEFVETRSAEPIGAATDPADDDDDPASPRPAPPPTTVRAVVNWSDVPCDDDQLRRLLESPGATIHRAGGSRSLEEDRQVIASLADGSGAVAVAVRSWEPPVLEAMDFLTDLRQALGKGAAIIVAPVTADAEPADPAHLAQWRRKVAALGDPWTSVAAVDREGTL